eukprot:CFRG7664T1
MINLLTRLNVIDNSGARLVMCIKSLRGPKRAASVGDLIVVSVKSTRKLPTASSKQQAGKGDVRRALVVRCKKGQKGVDGRQIVFGDNACILVNAKNEPLGTRIVSQTGVIGELISMRTSSKLQALIPKL